MKTLTLVTSGLPGIKDWLDLTRAKNLDYIARGALLMALDNFKHLAPNCRPDFGTDTIVLLRFRLDLRKTWNLLNSGNLWLWSRHYWEHSYAFSYEDWTFNLNEFRTLRTFVFKNSSGVNYNFEELGALLDLSLIHI